MQVFDGYEFHSVASLSEKVPVLSCGGLSKNLMIPGWRIGWILIHDRNGAFQQEVGITCVMFGRVSSPTVPVALSHLRFIAAW